MANDMKPKIDAKVNAIENTRVSEADNTHLLDDLRQLLSYLRRSESYQFDEKNRDETYRCGTVTASRAYEDVAERVEAMINSANSLAELDAPSPRPPIGPNSSDRPEAIENELIEIVIDADRYGL